MIYTNKYLWRVLNGLFGWHYIWMVIDRQYYDAVRVTMKPDGKLYGKAWIWDFTINQAGEMDIKYASVTKYSWGPLTCDLTKPVEE